MAVAPSKDSGPRVADLIEESVHLLRRNPQELAWYYAGTGPFVTALLYFWSYVAWFAPPDGEVAAGALVLAMLFGVMKAGQRRFALCLLGRRTGEMPQRWSWRQWLGETAAEFRIQASGILLIPLAALFGVPFGWVYGYYQTATALPPSQESGGPTRSQQAWRQIQLWPAQNHWALAILFGLWLMVYLNIAVAFYTVPAMATRWLGIKTIFAFSGWSYFNSTFLVLVAGLTHLLVDPLIKTFYLLRVFHGGARKTGADLRLVLAREKFLRRRTLTGAALLLLGSLLFCPPKARAADAVPVVQSAPVPVLDHALDRVLEEPEFRWRLRPLPVPPDQKKDGIVQGFVRSTFAILKQIVLNIIRWVRQASDWVSNLFPGSGEKTTDSATKAGGRNAFDWMAGLQLAAYLLLCVVGGFLLFVIWKVWQHNRLTRPLAASAPIPAATPDLRDESVEASRLSADGWLDLARQKVAAGEWRLALRALFLATLARHAQEGWLSLAKFKTNLDYETELRRRTRSRTEVVDDFRDRRRQFEEVWYGAVPANDGLARSWLRQMEVGK